MIFEMAAVLRFERATEAVRSSIEEEEKKRKSNVVRHHEKKKSAAIGINLRSNLHPSAYD